MDAFRLRAPLLATVAALLIAPSAAGAATDHVTSPGDTGKKGQLRYVIAHAKNGDVVLIGKGVDPSLTQGEIKLTKSLTIKGNGARSTTISANQLSRVFLVPSKGKTSPTIAVEDLTMTGGKTTDVVGTDVMFGGALIAFAGTVSLTDVTLTGNEAFTNSATTAEGGAIANAGANMTLDRVTVSGNSAVNPAGGGGAVGGGITTFSSMTIINSTIAGNTAHESASSASVAQGGGISSLGKTQLISTTVANNSAISPAAGSFVDGGNIVSNLGKVSLRNTLVAGGIAGQGSNCSGLDFADKGHNLESTTPSQCGLSAGSPDHDLIGSDPMFTTAQPANNGGPTNTLALGSDSLAIDYVPHADCTATRGKPLKVDQRKKPRPDGHEKRCDIGAYETQR